MFSLLFLTILISLLSLFNFIVNFSILRIIRLAVKCSINNDYHFNVYVSSVVNALLSVTLVLNQTLNSKLFDVIGIFVAVVLCLQYVQKKHPDYKTLKNTTVWSMAEFKNYIVNSLNPKKYARRNKLYDDLMVRMSLYYLYLVIVLYNIVIYLFILLIV